MNIDKNREFKEEIKRNLENYILQTNGKTYLTCETNTNLMARDCLNTIEQLISQLDIANEKLDKIDTFIRGHQLFGMRFAKTLYRECLEYILSIIGGE